MLRQRGLLTSENIKGVSLEVHQGDFSEQDRDVILEIQQEQYAHKYSAVAQEKLLAGLQQVLTSSDSKFYLYRKDGEIVAYVCFDHSKPEAKYMRSFMVNPKFEGGNLAQVLVEAALIQEGQEDSPIKLECDPDRVEFYKQFGFQPKRNYIDGSGLPTWEMLFHQKEKNMQQAA